MEMNHRNNYDEEKTNHDIRVTMDNRNSSIGSIHTIDEEELAINVYFRKLDVAKSILFKFKRYSLFAFVYLILWVTAIAGIILDPEFDKNATVWVVVFISIQSLSMLSNVILLRRILANEVICNSYVRCNVQNYMKSYQTHTPIISLYFKGFVGMKYQNQTKEFLEKSDRFSKIYIRIYYYMVLSIGFVAFMLWFLCYYLGHSFIILITPWAILTTSSWFLSRLTFNLLTDSLEFHKREFLTSPIFSNSLWDDLIKKLSNSNNYRKGEVIIEDIGLANEVVQAILENATSIPAFSREPSRTQSVAGESDGRMTSNDSNKTSSNRFDHIISNPLGLQIETKTRVALHNAKETKIAINDILKLEGKSLNLPQFRRDLFILQHTFQVYNQVLGNFCVISYHFSVLNN